MRPKKHDTTRSGDLFRARLDQIINLKNELAQLAGASIQEIERVMAELANAREMLRREATRLQGELNNYATMSQAAMSSMKIVSDSLVKWKSQTPKLP